VLRDDVVREPACRRGAEGVLVLRCSRRVGELAARVVMLVHLAGETIRSGRLVRVRCAWCGALIDEVNLAEVPASHPASREDERGDPRPLWSGLVGVEGDLRVSLPELGDAPMPPGSCLSIDGSVTR
jgi:hypothetical protein